MARQTAVVGLSDASRITAAYTHTCALRATGAVSCWGANGLGQLGYDMLPDARSPVAVAGLLDATQIAAFFQQTCARRATGGVVCWGNNADGQLGDGTTTHRWTPVPVRTLP
mgnify:CR=1 FL=1